MRLRRRIKAVQQWISALRSLSAERASVRYGPERAQERTRLHPKRGGLLRDDGRGRHEASCRRSHHQRILQDAADFTSIPIKLGDHNDERRHHSPFGQARTREVNAILTDLMTDPIEDDRRDDAEREITNIRRNIRRRSRSARLRSSTVKVLPLSLKDRASSQITMACARWLQALGFSN